MALNKEMLAGLVVVFVLLPLALARRHNAHHRLSQVTVFRARFHGIGAEREKGHPLPLKVTDKILSLSGGSGGLE